MVGEIAANPWRFQPHVEVWLLVVFLVASYIYVVRVLGPKAVPAGEPVITRRQLWCFIAGISILWLATDWPMHDIAEEYLYTVHMVQHMCLTYFMPPLVILATPEWFVRTLVGEGRAYRALRFMTFPVLAGLLFNIGVMVSHIPGVVNASVSNGPLHYFVHVVLVSTSILMWLPVCGPFKEFQITPMAKMIYLFLNSVVATVPAGWLTFAEGVVYKHYNIPIRVWGISVSDDQQSAGAIMKLGGSTFLWSIIGVMFYKHFVKTFRDENKDDYDHKEIEIIEEPLTTADVMKAFNESSAPIEK
jgi:putative membrane protein